MISYSDPIADDFYKIKNYESNVLRRLLVAVLRAGFARAHTRDTPGAMGARKCAHSHLHKA